MSLVTAYENKIREILTAEIGSEKIIQVFWEPDSGRAVFGYRGTHTSKSGRVSRKWQCFKIMVMDDELADALLEKGVSRDMWEKYLGVLLDNLGLDYEELASPAPFGEFGVVDDRFVDEPFSTCAWKDYMDAGFFLWWDELTTDEDFRTELAEKILSLQ